MMYGMLLLEEFELRADAPALSPLGGRSRALPAGGVVVPGDGVCSWLRGGVADLGEAVPQATGWGCGGPHPSPSR